MLTAIDALLEVRKEEVGANEYQLNVPYSMYTVAALK